MSSLLLTGAGPSGAGGFSPASIPGLEAWYDASAITGMSDGDPVASWTDLSGNGRNATQGTSAARPTYKTGIQNGKPVLRFDGVDDSLVLSSLAALSAATGFVVVRKVNDPGGGADGVWSFGATNDTFYGFSDGVIYDDFGSSARKTTVDPVPSLSASFRVYVAKSGPGVWTNYLDGTQLFTTATNTVSVSATPTIGRAIATTYFLGDIAELLIYDTALSDVDRQSVEAYLKAKWDTP